LLENSRFHLQAVKKIMGKIQGRRAPKGDTTPIYVSLISSQMLDYSDYKFGVT
jgi:hypothetical protein